MNERTKLIERIPLIRVTQKGSWWGVARRMHSNPRPQPAVCPATSSVEAAHLASSPISERRDYVSQIPNSIFVDNTGYDSGGDIWRRLGGLGRTQSDLAAEMGTTSTLHTLFAPFVVSPLTPSS
ncbi:unnamed protein product [Nezara viridula]|uniref:Uncharacterized protein n=1 Tax=Nezara viridula TaxID=85310 RepID=A0A9P0HNB4_NEZVI|nr:unnamed protein product [Nezara viridula]